MKESFLEELKRAYEYLEGKKTYYVAFFVAVATFAKLVGWITEDEFQAFVGFLGALGLWTIRQAVKKLE